VSDRTDDVAELSPDDEDERFVRFQADRDRGLRNELVEHYMGFAVHLARQFSADRASEDDLRQVAMIGLVKAVDRFDPTRGVPFFGFAGPTISGELKRHFRDATWTARVPRSAKELAASVRGVSEDLAQQLARAPTIDEIAEHLSVARDDVVTGLIAQSAYRASPLDPGERTDAGSSQMLIQDDVRFAAIEDQEAVEQLLIGLGQHERAVVRLRFFEELSQDEIAQRIGVSQMQVSRLLRKSFDHMRQRLNDEPGEH
jgi:RNA polymerase sigma-B factor